MISLGYGLFSGFIATIFISGIMWLQISLGIFTELDIIRLQARLVHVITGVPATMQTGWVSHFLIGTVLYGGIFGLFKDLIPGRTALGISTIWMLMGWLAAMVGFMPLAGAGLFGLKIGFSVPFVMLVLHIVFGVVLGYVYAHLHHHRITAQISDKRRAPPANSG